MADFELTKGAIKEIRINTDNCVVGPVLQVSEWCDLPRAVVIFLLHSTDFRPSVQVGRTVVVLAEMHLVNERAHQELTLLHFVPSHLTLHPHPVPLHQEGWNAWRQVQGHRL